MRNYKHHVFIYIITHRRLTTLNTITQNVYKPQGSTVPSNTSSIASTLRQCVLIHRWQVRGSDEIFWKQSPREIIMYPPATASS